MNGTIVESEREREHARAFLSSVPTSVLRAHVPTPPIDVGLCRRAAEAMGRTGCARRERQARPGSSRRRRAGLASSHPVSDAAGVRAPARVVGQSWFSRRAVAAALLGLVAFAAAPQDADAADDYPAGISTTGQVSVGGSVTGNLETRWDTDWFAVDLESGVTYQIDLEGKATDSGTLWDPYLRGIYEGQRKLASGTTWNLYVTGTRDDDGGFGRNARTVFTPTDSGTYYIAAYSFRGVYTGTYKLRVGTDIGPLDYRPPDLVSMVAKYKTVTLTFDEDLDEDSNPGKLSYSLYGGPRHGFTVQTTEEKGGTQVSQIAFVDSVEIKGPQVILTLGVPVRHDQTVGVTFFRGGGDPLRDKQGNVVTDLWTAGGFNIFGIGFDWQQVTNTTPNPAVTLSTTTLSVEEGDETGATYTVKLTAAPPSGETYYIKLLTERVEKQKPSKGSVSMPRVLVSPTILEFTSSNWNTAQTVTVTAPDEGTHFEDSVSNTAKIWHQERTDARAVTVTITEPEPAPDAPGDAPGVPDLQAEAGNGQVVLTWTAPEYAGTITGWELRHGATDADGGEPGWGAWTAIEGATAETTSHTVTGLDNGTEYAFELRAMVGAVAGDASPAVTATPLVAPPGAPDLQAKAGDGQVRLVWLPPPYEGAFTGWALRYGETGDGDAPAWGEWTAIEGAGPETQEHTVTGLDNGTEYSFEVRAMVGAVAGDASPAVTATPAEPLDADLTGSVPDGVVRRSVGGCRVDVAVRFVDADGDAVAVDAVAASDFTVENGRVGTPVADGDGLGWTVPAWAAEGFTGLLRVRLPATSRWQAAEQAFRVSGGGSCAPAARSALASLSLGGLALDPAFDAGTTAYTAAADAATGAVTVTAAAVYGTAAVAIAPADADAETDGHQVALAQGASTDITVTVTPADGDIAAQVYTVTVTRAAADPDATRAGAVALDIAGAARSPKYYSGYTLDRAGGDKVDYYTFTTDGRHELGLGVRDQSIELKVTLENADGETVGTAGPPADPSKDQRHIEWLTQTIEPGTYYVRVEALADGATDYYIRFGLADAPAPVVSDPDGTRAGAVSLGAQSPERGVQYFNGYTLDRAGGDRVDYYTFTTGGRHALGLGARDQSVELKVVLEDANGATVGTAGPPADPSKDQVYIEWLARTIDAGTYYIRVEALADGATDYYLRFGLTAPPPELSVADAQVEEGPGATLDFAVTLDRSWSKTVTVDYATSDGTATAGDDYTATSGTLTFASGETSKTISVPVLDDVHDEGEETLTLTLSSATGATIADGMATGTIENSDPLQQAWLARFGRTAATHVTDAVGERLRGAAGHASHLTIGGYRLPLGQPADQRRSPDGSAAAPKSLSPGGRGPGEGGKDAGSVNRRAPRFQLSGTSVEDARGDNRALARSSSPPLPPVGEGRGEGAEAERALAAKLWGPLSTDAAAEASAATAVLAEVARMLGVGPGGAAAGPGTGPHDAPWRAEPGPDPRLGRSVTPALNVDLRQVLLGSSFRLNLGATDAGAGVPRLTAWGRFAGTTFAGQDGALAVDGDVFTGTVGVDSEWDRLLAGVAVAHSRGDGSFNDATPGMADRGQGGLEQTLTSVHPYVRYAVTDRLDVWGLVGYGWGELEMELESGVTMETDTTLLMGAFGGRGLVLAPEDTGGVQLATRTDAMLTRTSADAAANLAATDADAHRLRLILEGSRAVTWDDGRRLTPTMELGLRHDWGDAETGFGVEVGGRVQYADPGLGLTVEGAVRGLLAHEDADYQEWGASGTVRLAPGVGGQGLSLTLAPTWGAATSGVEGLWSRQTTQGLAPQGRTQAPGGRLQAEVGYGFAAFDMGLLTPYAGTVLAEGADRTYRVGTRLQMTGRWATGLTLNLEGTRQEPAGPQPVNQGLRLQVEWGF